MKKDNVARITYVMELTNGKFRMATVPTSWRVTFGPAVPSERSGRGNFALRFYDRGRQRAAFTDVNQYWDSKIELQKMDSVPKNPKVVEKFPALKKAWEQYEVILKMCLSAPSNQGEDE